MQKAQHKAGRTYSDDLTSCAFELISCIVQSIIPVAFAVSSLKGC